jgi:hypothetical protein
MINIESFFTTWNKIKIGVYTMDKIILPDSDESAQLVTVKMWKTSTGRYFLEDDEKTAREYGATHATCRMCGDVYKKNHFTICDDCREEKKIEAYNRFCIEPWDENNPICTMDCDQWFHDPSQLDDYCDEFGIEKSELHLCHTEPLVISPLDVDTIMEDSVDARDCDVDTPQELIDAVDAYNEAIEKIVLNVYEKINKAVEL